MFVELFSSTYRQDTAYYRTHEANFTNFVIVLRISFNQLYIPSLRLTFILMLCGAHIRSVSHHFIIISDTIVRRKQAAGKQ